jgi:hypothetical protein
MRFLVSLAATAALTLTASAAPLSSFTNDNVQAFLKKAGATDIESESSGGVQFVHFSYKGLKYSSSIRFCDEGTTKNCSGLLLAVGFEAEAADTLETLNSFNYGFPIATAVKPDSKTLMFGRFVTSLGTVEEGNIAANLGMLIATPAGLWRVPQDAGCRFVGGRQHRAARAERCASHCAEAVEADA